MGILAHDECAKVFDGARKCTCHGAAEERHADAIQSVLAADLDGDELAGCPARHLSIGQRLVRRKLNDVDANAIDLHGVSPRYPVGGLAGWPATTLALLSSGANCRPGRACETRGVRAPCVGP